MTHSTEKDAGLTKGPDESQTEFTIRLIRAEAFDEGVSCAGRYGHEDTWDWPENTPYRWNPYRVAPGICLTCRGEGNDRYGECYECGGTGRVISPDRFDDATLANDV